MSSGSACHRTRQDPGEPAGAGDPVNSALADLESRSTPELRAEWRSLYRTDPPTRLSRDLLLRGVAFRRQERLQGGLSIATKRRLDALAAQLDGKAASAFAPAAALKPGTRLVREWHGRAHAVIVLEDGFEYQGRRYASLSKIASLITGTRWSGPVFFGLKRRPATASARSGG
jgi:Protein of unknown function (DUF2924)